MKLTVEGLRPLVTTPAIISEHLSTIQSIASLDLSNGAITGNQITDLLRFVLVSSSPIVPQSVDLGHNQLGDAGAIALARLIQASASKLTNLKALDLFENGVRDEGALVLMNAIQEEVAAGNLPLLSDITLYDNVITATCSFIQFQSLALVDLQNPVNNSQLEASFVCSCVSCCLNLFPSRFFCANHRQN